MARFGAPSWGPKSVQEALGLGSNFVLKKDVKTVIFYHPYQGFGWFSASNLSSETAFDGSDFVLGVVLTFRVNLELVRSRFGSV